MLDLLLLIAPSLRVYKYMVADDFVDWRSRPAESIHIGHSKMTLRRGGTRPEAGSLVGYRLAPGRSCQASARIGFAMKIHVPTRQRKHRAFKPTIHCRFQSF
jgi:hypothetical protein